MRDGLQSTVPGVIDPSIPECVPGPALAPGSRIAVVAPAGPMLPRALDPGLQPLRDAGFEVLVPDDLLRGQGGYLAGSDEERLAELVAAYDDEAVDAILCARGGYGTMRLLPALERWWSNRGDRTGRVPRLVGFSDITALHAFQIFRMGTMGLHAPMPFNLGRNSVRTPAQQRSATWLLDALQSPEPFVAAPRPSLIPVRSGRATGPLVGGNLTLVASLYRSPWLPSLRGCLLFVEDVGEAAYRLDRLVTALALRGAAREVAGVVVGGFDKCGVPSDVAAADVARHFAAWDVPVVRGLDAGHREPNRTLWLGAVHTLDANRGTLSLDATRRTV